MGTNSDEQDNSRTHDYVLSVLSLAAIAIATFAPSVTFKNAYVIVLTALVCLMGLFVLAIWRMEQLIEKLVQRLRETKVDDPKDESAK